MVPWVIHDLRRAVATHMNEIGVAPHIVEAVLGHVSGSRGGIAGVYNLAAYEADKRAAMLRWDEHLMAAIEGRDPSSRSSGHDRAPSPGVGTDPVGRLSKVAVALNPVKLKGASGAGPSRARD